MNLVTRLRVRNDAGNVAGGRFVDVEPGDFGVLLSPGEECTVTAFGADAVPTLTVVESASVTTVVCEGAAVVTLEGPGGQQRYEVGGAAGAEPAAAPDRGDAGDS